MGGQAHHEIGSPPPRGRRRGKAPADPRHGSNTHLFRQAKPRPDLREETVEEALARGVEIQRIEPAAAPDPGGRPAFPSLPEGGRVSPRRGGSS